jgi:two-component system, OmpR family, response regulator MprA
MKILVVEDDPAVRDSVRRALELKDYSVETVADGPQALTAVRASEFDAIVLDVMLPALDGLEVCRRLRGEGDRVPILMLTARDEIDDRVAGLDAGADDYLAKPFALEEFLARLRAITRRGGENGGRVTGRPEVLSFADLRLDTGEHRAYRGERRLELTRTEYLLLELFLRHPRHVLTRTTIFEQVWGYDFGTSSNSLGVYIGYLRRKLEQEGEPRLMQTVRGVGYVLREE